MMKSINVVMVVTIWMAVVSLFVFGLAKTCFSQNDQTALALVQCLVAECDRCNRHPDEVAGIAWVLKKRMQTYNANPRNTNKISYYTQVKSYCSVFDKRSKSYYGSRPERIRKSTFLSIRHLSFITWDNLRKFAERFLRSDGGIADPYPEANHFGGTLDIARAEKRGCKIAGKHCNKRGQWCNYFLRCIEYR